MSGTWSTFKYGISVTLRCFHEYITYKRDPLKFSGMSEIKYLLYKRGSFDTHLPKIIPSTHTETYYIAFILFIILTSAELSLLCFPLCYSFMLL